MARRGALVQRIIRYGGLVLLGLAAAAGVPLLELFVFRRYGASPVPGPYDLDGTVTSDTGGGSSVGWVWLGDSLSAGVGADHADESFPRLAAVEVAARTGHDVELICLAVPGATSADVLSGQVPAAVSVLQDGMIAVVAAGCNDVLCMVHPTAFRVTYTAILRALAATGSTVVAVGVPDLGSTMARLAQPLRAIVGWAAWRLDSIVRDVACEAGVSYVAINSTVSAAGRRWGRAELSADGWHPNREGYRIWADRVAAHLLDLHPSESSGSPVTPTRPWPRDPPFLPESR